MALTDPFGDDKEDFEIGHLLSRHIWVSSRKEMGIRLFPKVYKPILSLLDLKTFETLVES